MDSVTDGTGHTFTKQFDILKAQRDYFSNLYQKRTPDRDNLNKVQTFLIGCSIPSLSDEEKNECEGLLDKHEIHTALKDMQNGSAPGTDGLSVDFLKMFWERLSDILMASFNAAFVNGSLSCSQRKAVNTLNHTQKKNLPRNNLKRLPSHFVNEQ